MSVKFVTQIITLMEKTVHYKKLTNVNNMLQTKIHVLHVMPVIIYQIMLAYKILHIAKLKHQLMNVKLVTQNITLMAKSVQNKIQLPIVKHMLQIKIHVLHVMPVIIYQIMLV